jgi:hypothetical protein
MARGQAHPKVAGASGDVRNAPTNIGGAKHDRDQMDSTSPERARTRTGSPAGDNVLRKKAAESAEKR